MTVFRQIRGGNPVIATNKEFVFQSMKINAHNVSSSTEWKKGYIDYVVNSVKNSVMLEDVLKHAGFEFVDVDAEEVEEDILDLSNFSKEQVLNLVS